MQRTLFPNHLSSSTQRFVPLRSAQCRRRNGNSRQRPALPDEIEMPDMQGDVEYYQRQLHGKFDAQGRLLEFEDGLDRLSTSSSLIHDRSDWGRLRFTGKGALEFLHNRTTNSFGDRQRGEGLDTLFLQSKGRIIDLATAYVLGEAVLVILSPNVQDSLTSELEKFVFPGDEVELVDVRASTRLFSLIGPQSKDLLGLLNIKESVLDGVYGSHEVVGFNNTPVIVAKGNELSRKEGYTLIVDDSVSGDLYKNLVDAGGLPIGLLDWEKLRVLQGRPGLETEFKAAANPFEVGLFHAVSLDKGCFLGQESISRIYTKNSIRKRLWGVKFNSLPAGITSGESVVSEGREVGKVSSIPAEIPGQNRQEFLCLAFLRCTVDKKEVLWSGKEVEVAGIRGIIQELDYNNLDFENGVGAPRQSQALPTVQANSQSDKEKKLAEMQARLDAFMKQQKEET